MAESSKAVFLSYASQDAAPAKRICEALRAAGVEVWFDQSELRGGDSWDAKIRKQIKECALFVPIISANTNARPEGYFRLEWKLAVDRSHLLADDHPFLFPVVIDDTADATARVPEKFREVQWTRLNVKDTPETLARRVGKLLDRDAPEEHVERAGGRVGPARRAKHPSWLRYAWMVVGLVFAVLYVVRPMWQSKRRSPEEIAKLVAQAKSFADLDTKPPAPPAPEVAPPSEARQLVAKAEEMFLALDSSRDDFALAEDLLKQAVAKAPADAEVWAAYAYLHERYGARGWDSTNERRELARQAVQRALRLDPTSYEARFAAASLFTGTGEKENREHEKELRALLVERPDDKRVLRATASVLRYLPDREEETIQLYDRAARLPGGDPLALYNKALALWFAGRAREAATAVTAALAQQSFVSAQLLNAYFALSVEGDLDRAKTLLEQLPSSTLQDDRGCYFATLVYAYRGEPDQALAILQSFPRDWINDSWYHGPRGLLVGNALAQAGRPDAAAVEWRAALKVVEQRLAANPNNVNLLGLRLLLLARLGETAAAQQLLPAVHQMLQAKNGALESPWYTDACLALGDRAEALRVIGLGLQSKRHAVYFPASDLRHNPVWAPLRSDPEFQRLIAEADRLEAADAAGTAPVARAAVIDGKSVAVLAFANLSDDKGNEYFSDGISEELLTVLQKIPGLHVAARTSSFYFKGKDATAQEIGAKLGVANLVEGSVQKSGTRVKVTARLSRAATGEELWSRSYTRELKDVFALQEELAGAIVGELRGRLSGAVEAAAVKAAVQGGTTNPEAYQLYLQGRFFSRRNSEKGMVDALAALERAVELDPGFALAWADMGLGYVWLCGFSSEVGQAQFTAHLAKARESVNRALALSPKLPEALLAQALIQLNFDFDRKGAGETLQTALVLAPADPSVLLVAGNLASARGDNAQAIEFYRQAVSLDPVNMLARSFLAGSLTGAGQYADAEKEYARMLELNRAAPGAHAGMAISFLFQGRWEEAVTAAQSDTNEWARLLVMALARFSQHRLPESDAALAELTAKFGETAAYQIAEVHAYRGDRDRAFEWLERAVRQRDSGLVGLRNDRFMASLKDDPRWPVLLHKLGLADQP
jgi:TolB-like protein/Flp pilus assembly protein TadD